NKEVQDYNIALAKYVATSGVDEIQFDYVRFPAEGNQADAQFAFQKDPKMHRDDVIANFLDRAYTELHPMGVLVSLDVFGIMAWQRQVDLSHTGQDITKMAKHCDVLSPMIYPSHFFGMDGYTAPGDAPEHFISVSMDRFEKVTAGTGVVLRPWLQAFHWRTKTYSPEYILKQVSASHAHHGDGFLFWNAANDYSKPFAAMPTMMANPQTYLYTPATAVAQSSPDAATPEKAAQSQAAGRARQ
ncbi:MAG TPA: putative glycoside hydrolase, partial [Candidatus Angelobacter sp.]|nr:putative glycoside hydrolase [Candidatus Angelobacter sp.]